MKKRLISVIAAAAVMTCGSPLLANARYTIVTTKLNYTDYTKLDFMSDGTRDYYIYTGSDMNYTHRDGKVNFTRSARVVTNLSDRVYFNVNTDDTATVTDTLDKIDDLLKDLVTENGDRLKAGWTGNNYSPNIEFEYYIMPVNDNPESNKPLEITANDARKIKAILEKDNFASNMFYSTDVCVPNGGFITLDKYIVPKNGGMTRDEINEKAEKISAQANKIMKENGIDLNVINVTSDYSYVTINHVEDTTFEEMLAASELLLTNFDSLSVIAAVECSYDTSFGGIDLSNAVDGDSNCDEQMDMSDVVFIMQALANPDKYQLSEQGSFNADLDGNGITVGDAQAIQEKLLGLN